MRGPASLDGELSGPLLSVVFAPLGALDCVNDHSSDAGCFDSELELSILWW